MKKILSACLVLLGSVLQVSALAPSTTEIESETQAAKLRQKPNILWIYVDDMNDWFGCYGEKRIQTPHVDQMAKQGVLFKRAYAPAPVCSATRSAVMTGCMQTTTGLHNHRTFVKKKLDSKFITVPELFRAQGYVTFNTRKTDYNFAFNHADLYSPFLKQKATEKDFQWLSELKGKPFFGQLQFAGGKVGGEAGGRYPAKSRISDKDIIVPPQYPNTAVFRNGIARHLEQTKKMDENVGRLVKALEQHDLYDNTIIMFFTDHGYQLPRAKQFVYEEGIRVPLIVTNLKGKNGSIRNEPVSLVDLGPTSLQLAGIKVPEHMEGKQLFAADYETQDYIISARDRLDFTVDRIRAVVTARFKYIKNFHPERPLTTSNYRDGYATFKELRKLRNQNKLSELHQKIYFHAKSKEELYDLEKDPNEVNNLAADPKFAEELKRHREILNEWTQRTGDKGGQPESEAELKAQLKRWKKKATAPEFDRVR